MILKLLHRASVVLILAAVLMGYGVALGRVSAGAHIAYGFAFALVISFTHAMTLFYFAGMGVSMRRAAAGVRSGSAFLEQAESMRRRLALPLGLALVTLMAAAILGGGSHTRTLPSWVHHIVSLAALASNLFACARSIRLIRANESVIQELEARLRGDASRP